MWQDGYSHIPAKKKSPKAEVGQGREIGYPPVAIPKCHTITITITEEKGGKLCEVQVDGEGDEIAINLSFLIYRIGRLKWVSRHIKGKRQKKF